MLDYAALNALAAVVREGSFERAARALHVTPSAVSQRIRQLEERTGGALLVRGQPCVATEAGLQLCRHVERVGMLEHELREALPALGMGGGEAGERVTVRVAVNADSLATWFIDAAASFAAQAPAALLDLTVDDQDHTAERLRSGAVLAAVTALAQPVAGCNSEALGTMHYVAAASPGFVRAHFAKGVGARTLAERAQPGVRSQGPAAGALGAAHLPPQRRDAAPLDSVAHRLRRGGARGHGLGHASGQHGGRGDSQGGTGGAGARLDAAGAALLAAGARGAAAARATGGRGARGRRPGRARPGLRVARQGALAAAAFGSLPPTTTVTMRSGCSLRWKAALMSAAVTAFMRAVQVSR
jgi:DNA-binding transcriptional LysR family regulator